MRRLAPTLQILRDEYPELPVSVDTFRAEVARWAVQEYGVSMINDISGGALDPEMYTTIAELQVPYVLMHMRVPLRPWVGRLTTETSYSTYLITS